MDAFLAPSHLFITCALILSGCGLQPSNIFFLSSFHLHLFKHSSCIFELISCSNTFKLCEVFYHKSISKPFDFLLHYIQYNFLISHIPNIHSLALEVTDFGRNTSMDVHIISTSSPPLQISADFH